MILFTSHVAAGGPRSPHKIPRCHGSGIEDAYCIKEQGIFTKRVQRTPFSVTGDPSRHVVCAVSSISPLVVRVLHLRLAVRWKLLADTAIILVESRTSKSRVACSINTTFRCSPDTNYTTWLY